MSQIRKSLRNQVEQRAGDRCEYCQLAQEGQEATFHIDHVIPQSAGGETTLDNLALACVSCSLRKSSQQVAFDREFNQHVPLFNPRTQVWIEHFRWELFTIAPLTSTGRVTVAALDMNRPLIIAIRREEADRGRLPA